MDARSFVFELKSPHTARLRSDFPVGHFVLRPRLCSTFSAAPFPSDGFLHLRISSTTYRIPLYFISKWHHHFWTTIRFFSKFPLFSSLPYGLVTQFRGLLDRHEFTQSSVIFLQWLLAFSRTGDDEIVYCWQNFMNGTCVPYRGSCLLILAIRHVWPEAKSFWMRRYVISTRSFPDRSLVESITTSHDSFFSTLSLYHFHLNNLITRINFNNISTILPNYGVLFYLFYWPISTSLTNRLQAAAAAAALSLLASAWSRFNSLFRVSFISVPSTNSYSPDCAPSERAVRRERDSAFSALGLSLSHRLFRESLSYSFLFIFSP